VKRGWITWDQTELPHAAFEARLDVARKSLAARDLPALIVYTDIWCSNRVRHFSNFMPYWNRALLVIPREQPPLLLCGLSPRVYPWIRSVTILDDILPSPNLAQRLLQLCAERQWKRIGALHFPSFPHDLFTPLQNVVEGVSLTPAPDEWELAMYRRAAKLARQCLMEEMAHGAGLTDHEFTGRLERKFRRAGAEDLVILLTNGSTAPMPARGEKLGASFSVSLALEYRGHWVKVVRNAVEPVEVYPVRELPANAYTETLAGPYPFQSGTGPIFAARWETLHQGLRLFHGDTYRATSQGAAAL
jgi:hypothetical protein